MSSFDGAARTLLATAVVTMCAPAAAGAQALTFQSKPDSTKEEVVQTTLSAGALVAAGLLDRGLKAPACRWCDRDAQGRDTLNGFDRAARNGLVWTGSGARRANTVSNVFEATTVALPVVLLSTSNPSHWSGHDRLDGFRMMLWAMAANTATTSGLKRAFARERPFVHFKNPDVKRAGDENASFPSGHTSSAFALVFASARACRILRCGHEKRLWLVGVPLASMTGYLRIGADKHYATDVLTGAGIGATVGWFTPQLYATLRRDGRRPAVQPVVGGSILGVVAAWSW